MISQTTQISLFPVAAVRQGQTNVLPFFGKHQGTPPKLNWLYRAYHLCCEDPAAFSRDDICLDLGVAQSTVKAIRFWAVAFKILEEYQEGLKPTRFGDFLLHPEEGLDPYFEHHYTPWLLHWQLYKPPCSVPSWIAAERTRMAAASGFTEDRLDQVLSEFKAELAPQKSLSSVRMDRRCFLLMYAPQDCRSMETAVESFLWDMQWLYQDSASESKHRYFWNANPRVPEPIFWAACFDYMSYAVVGDRCQLQRDLMYGESTLGQAAVDRLVAPGRVFNLGIGTFWTFVDRFAGLGVESVELRRVNLGEALEFVLKDHPLSIQENLLRRFYE